MIDSKCVTNGGRVLNVVGIDSSLDISISKTYETLKKIDFDGKYLEVI